MGTRRKSGGTEKGLTGVPTRGNVPHVPTMAPTTYKLRLDSEQLGVWQKAADKAGIKLAVWVREGLDKYAGSDGENLRRTPDLPLGGRRVDDPGGVVGGPEAAVRAGRVRSIPEPDPVPSVSEEKGEDEVELDSGEIAGRAEPSSAASPVRPMLAPVAQTTSQSAPVDNLREMPPQPKATRSGFKKKQKEEKPKPSKASGKWKGNDMCRHGIFLGACFTCRELENKT